MDNFEYDITKHQAEDFSKVVYFCDSKGECRLDDVPNQELENIKQMLNNHGDDGWELVQFNMGNDGLIAFWKRRIVK